MLRLLSRTSCSFSFSSSSKVYDIISIGPYANRIAKTLSKESKIPLSILTVEQNPYVIQPTLVAVQNNPVVALKQDNHEFSDVEMGVGVKLIDMKNNRVVLKNGAEYQYKQCIYSGDRADWQQGSSSLNLDYVFSSKEYSNIGALKNKRHGNIIFTLPTQFDQPWASESYLMALVKSQIKNNGRVIVLGAIQDNNIKELLTSHQVEVLSQEKWEINFGDKQLYLPDQSTIPFQAIFEYLPTHIPSLLGLRNVKDRSSIYDLTSPTLTHPENPNLHILPCFPSIPFPFINHLSKTIAQNILYSTLNIQKRVSPPEYQSSKYLWVSHNRVLNALKESSNKPSIYVKTRTYWKKLWERANLEAQINMGCGTYRSSQFPSVQVPIKQ